MVNIWKEGEYIDLWSLIHLLSGFLLGAFLLFIFKLSFIYSFFIAILVLILAEAIEPIQERSTNKIIDILIGLLGFIISSQLYLIIDKNTFTTLTVIILIIWIALNIWAWHIVPKKGVLKGYG